MTIPFNPPEKPVELLDLRNPPDATFPPENKTLRLRGYYKQ